MTLIPLYVNHKRKEGIAEDQAARCGDAKQEDWVEERGMTQLKTTWLVQRLQKPYKGNADNPFNFGGGLPRGGMNEEGYRALNQIFTFDYMGAAEFEFGAVPKAIYALAKGFAEGNGVTGEFKIDGVPVYYLTHKNIEKETMQRIKDLAKDPYITKIRLKEWTAFDSAIAARNGTLANKRGLDSAMERIGWIELDNCFMWFVDKEAFEKFKIMVES